MKLLLVEDDLEMAARLQSGLREIGHRVDHAANGRDGLDHAVGETYDVIILDRMLPKLDGMEVVRNMRQKGVSTPVLMLTALGGLDDRVEGLEAGSDDYLVKPFAFSELSARVNALGRRSSAPAATEIEVGDLKIDLVKRIATRGRSVIDLQPREFRLLEYLARHAGRVVTRAMLLEAVWGYQFEPRTNIVEAQVSRLRRKIGVVKGGGELIHTVRGTGYRLQAPD